jgi:putative ABC transport system permease protein
MRPLLLLRWAVRDLRARWLQVAAIALIIGIGTGVYAALGSTAEWRRQSNDASFELLGMYDLRVQAAPGAEALTGELLAVLDRLPDPGIVVAAEERLVLPTQVDASTGDEAVLVPGRMVGVDVRSGGPNVNAVHVSDGRGRTLRETDDGHPVAVLEQKFADFHDLPPQGTLQVSGGREVRYVGAGLSPEYFLVVPEEGGLFARANFAVLFVPLGTAQELAGRPAAVNDLVVRLRPGADPAAAGADLEAALASAVPGLGATVMQARDEDAYRVLYDDIEADQQLWNLMAGLILVGAAVGAFNLISRMVESQRREIGIGMALGAPPRQLAWRPMLVGFQVALLGVVAGVAVGSLVVLALRPVFSSMLPMPIWLTEVQASTFLRGAAIGVLIPVVATAWPVWRAVRVMPVDAITTTHRRARSGASRLLRRLAWPASAFRRMPLANVLRSPRRTLLTGLGIGAAIATLVAILGMIDSFVDTMEDNEQEQVQGTPGRIVVAFDGLVGEDGPEVAAVRAAESVGRSEPVLRLGGVLDPDGQALDALVQVLDLDSGLWAPSLVEGSLPPDRSGIVLAGKAAQDLGLGPGDVVTVEHPARDGDGIGLVRSQLTVTAIHPAPFRFMAYLDRSQLSRFGAEGITNQLHVVPAPGRTTDDVKRELFRLEGVASVQEVDAMARVVRERLDEFAAVFRVLQLFILGLALLIAYNTTSINADERARERATLFALGLPVRRVVALETVEGLLVGVLGTGIGLALGGRLVRVLTETLTTTSLPELGLEPAVSAETVVTALVLGVVAVGVAPLLTVRRLRRMDIPATLRVVE